MSITAKSVPTTTTAAASAPSSAVEESPAVDSMTASGPVADAAIPPTRSPFAFQLVLTIVAVLPIALGIGAVRLKASAHSAIPQVSTDGSEHEAPESQPIPNKIDRRFGDQLFFEHRYEVALQYYQSLGSSDSSRLPPDLLYRIALCQEALGSWDESLNNYQQVAVHSENPTLLAAARFGQARLCLRMNRPVEAVALLRSLSTIQQGETTLPRNMSHDVAFLIPLALAQNAVALTQTTRRTDPSLTGDLVNWSLEAALAWADVSTPALPSETDETAPDVLLSVQLDQRSLSPKDVTSLEAISVRVICRHQPIGSLFGQLSEQCGWSVDCTELSGDTSLNRTVNIVSESQPVSLLLTLICSDLQAVWTLEGQKLVVTRSDPTGNLTRQMLDRTLLSLTNWMPDYRLADHARFARASLVQCDGELTEAALRYSSLTSRDSSPLSVQAAYRAAIDFERVGDYSRACDRLTLVVNGTLDQAMLSESLIRLGRLLLDRGEVQDAIFQFRRATEARNPDDQARGAVMLGVAFLAQEKYQEAAEAVLARKSQMEIPFVRNAAAFVTAFARWHALKGEMQEREAVYLYRSLTSMTSNVDWLGETGQMLIGKAYSDMGFDKQMVDLYCHLLESGVTENIAAQLTFALGSYEQANGRFDAARNHLEPLASKPLDRWQNRSRIKLAEIALSESRPNDCLTLCELLLASRVTSRREILKLMGRSYEQLGEDGLAALCYAGHPPTP